MGAKVLSFLSKRGFETDIKPDQPENQTGRTVFSVTGQSMVQSRLQVEPDLMHVPTLKRVASLYKKKTTLSRAIRSGQVRRFPKFDNHFRYFWNIFFVLMEKPKEIHGSNFPIIFITKIAFTYHKFPPLRKWGFEHGRARNHGVHVKWELIIHKWIIIYTSFFIHWN